MKKWVCPECGERNSYQIILCPCGFKSEILATTVENQQPKSSVEDNKARSLKDENIYHDMLVNLSRYKTYPSSLFGNWFDLSTWRYSYRRWMLLTIISIFILRGTIDGLCFIAFLAYAIAARLENKKRYGVPIIAGKKKEQSILNYGVCRSITAIIAPILFSDVKIPEDSPGYVPPEISQLFCIRIIGTMCILHLYISVVILADSINHEITSNILTILNSPVEHLLPYWRGFKITAEQFTSHGYGYRTPLLSHMYILYFCGAVVFVIIFFTSLIVTIRASSLIERYNNSSKLVQAMKRQGSKSFFGKVFNRFLHWYPVRIMLVILGSWAVVYYLYSATRLLLYFPGDLHPRHGRYIWMYSYAYNDNIAFFTPVYLHLPAVIVLCGLLLILLEPLYRSGLFLFTNLTK